MAQDGNAIFILTIQCADKTHSGGWISIHGRDSRDVNAFAGDYCLNVDNSWSRC
jgi:hypothetical protein